MTVFAVPQTEEISDSAMAQDGQEQSTESENEQPMPAGTFWWLLIMPVVLVLAVLGTVVFVVVSALKKNQMNWRD